MGPKKGGKAVDADAVEKTPAELEAEALEALEEAKRAEEARVIEEARLNAEMEANILRVAAEKAEVRRLEQEAFAVKKREDNERKIRFAEAKLLRDKEDAERAEAARVKMLEEEAKKRKREEENRLRKLEQARLKKLLDDKVEYRRKQALRPVPSGVSEEVHACCISGDAEALVLLCTEWEGHPVLNALDEDSWSPAVWACKKGHLECLELLIANWENEFDSKSNNKAAVLKFLDGAMDSSGMTLLMFAAIADACPIIRLLVTKGVKKDTVNEDGFTAHLWAAKCGNLLALQLLEELRCSTSSLTRGGLSALECARVGSARRGTGQKGKEETVAYLAIRQAELDAAIAHAAAVQETVE